MITQCADFQCRSLLVLSPVCMAFNPNLGASGFIFVDILSLSLATPVDTFHLYEVFL